MKAIIFDLGGVVLSENWGWKQRELFSKKFNLDHQKTKEYHESKAKDLNIGNLSEKDFFTGLFKYQEKTPEVEKAISFLRSKDRLFPEVLDLIKELKKKYKIFAITNEIREAAEIRSEKFRLGEIFDKIFVSGSIKFQKPEKGIFLYVLNEIKILPEEIIFIDNVEKNLIPAGEIGMKCILFKEINQLRKDLEKIL